MPFLCTLLACQQVAAVVNNGPSSEVEESPGVSSDTKSTESISKDQEDSLAVDTKEQSNRREAPALGDAYGAPVASPADSYLVFGPSNPNLPVPVYGVPDAPSNNVIYPAPPPDIPPPISLPPISYGLPQISNSHGSQLSSSFGSHGTSNLYGHQQKFSGTGGNRIKPVYGPPRFQYGPPGKPFHNSKLNFKFPSKTFGNYKKFPTNYGPPSGYLKDNFNSGKYKFNNYKVFSHGGSSFKHNSHLGGSISPQYGAPNPATQYGVPSFPIKYGVPSVSSQYGAPTISAQYGAPTVSTQFAVPNFGSGPHGDAGLTAPGPLATQYGAPDEGQLSLGIQSLSLQYGAPNDNYIESLKPQYGPPQPSPHPRPPHPGAPAPPTPPDIKYDGWQPIPGLVSRIPSPVYGGPSSDQHIGADLSYNKDLSPPPVNTYTDEHTSSGGHGSVANLALEHSQRIPQPGASDSYGAPLNTVTGSGGIVSSSGDEAQGKHQAHSQAHQINVGLSGSGGGQEIQAIKSVAYELFSGGAGGNHGLGGYSSSISDSYGAPHADSYSANGPYAAGHSYNDLRSSGSSSGKFSFGSKFNQNSFGSFNSHKSHGYKGLSFSNSGIGLIPPSGVYGVPPSGQYGTPLYSSHGSPLNALKINPPKYPVLHAQPIPPSVFNSITKQVNGFDGYKGGANYIPPSDFGKPSGSYGAPSSSNLYSLPSSHSAISFQTVNHGSSDLNFNVGGATQSGLSSYGVPLNAIDGSYNIPQGHTHAGGKEFVELDLTHPGLTIDLTQGQTHAHPSGQALSDCTLKAQSLPSLNYGVPSSGVYSSDISGISSADSSLGGYSSSSSHSGSSINAESFAQSGSAFDIGSGGHSSGSLDLSSLALPSISFQSGLTDSSIHSSSGIPGPVYGAPETLPVPSAFTGYQVNNIKPFETYGVPDLDGSHSQKNTVVKVNAIEGDSHGTAYGKHVAASFGPSSELIQSHSIDLNNIPLKGALGSYTLQIQSLDGTQSEMTHGQVLNDGLLQSILSAIEQPKVGEKSQPVDFQKSLEKQNFVTNDTISSVVGQFADPELRHSTELVKDEIDKTQELADADTQATSAVKFILPQSSSSIQETEDRNEEIEEKTEEIEDVTLPLVEDNGIALYFSNKQRAKKGTDEANSGDQGGHN